MDRPTFKSASHNGVSLPEEQEKSRSFYRWWTRIGLVIVVILIALFYVPVPYAIKMPGSTFNVLGSANGVPMLQIEGTDPATGEPIQQDTPQSTSYRDRAKPGQGQLRMVAVKDVGQPGRSAKLLDLVLAYFEPHSAILDYDEVYPADLTQDQNERLKQELLDNSVKTSQVAALEYLGWEVPATVTIEGVMEGSNAEGAVMDGDTLLAITTPDGVRHGIRHASTTAALMRTIPAGSEVTITVDRSGTTLNLSFATIASSTDSRGSMLGVYLSVDPALPVDITVNIDGVGGPSAGMMFSLSIIDRLTPGDMTGGNVIAGTGTMSYDGYVGRIGGIQQKLWGAHRDGAQWFLAPSENCNEVVGHVPDGLRVVSVSTLDEAVSAVRSIADGTGDALPTCQ